MKLRNTLLAGASVLACGLAAATANADPTSGTLFYTTFASQGGNSVFKVNYNFTGAAFTLSGDTPIAQTVTNSDGISFLPNGQLAVGGRTNLTVDQLSPIPPGTPITNVAAGTGGYFVTLNKFTPAGSTILYNMWNGPGMGGTNPFSAIPLIGGGIAGSAGINYTVTCAGGSTCQMAGTVPDIRGLTFDPHNNTYYYGSAPDSALGDFGTAVINDVAHTIVLTPLVHNTSAHDVTFDPFTNDLLTGSGSVVNQFSEAGALLSTHTFAGTTNIDAVGTDGAGHLFGADNGGDLVFIDYDVSKLIGAGTNFFAQPFLKATLDDIAQFVVPPPPTPEPTSLAVLGSALVGFGLLRRRRNRV